MALARERKVFGKVSGLAAIGNDAVTGPAPRYCPAIGPTCVTCHFDFFIVQIRPLSAVRGPRVRRHAARWSCRGRVRPWFVRMSMLDKVSPDLVCYDSAMVKSSFSVRLMLFVS